MKVLLLGKDGQLGWELHRALTAMGEVLAAGRADLDLEDLDRIASFVRQSGADLVVNAAAYTHVDQAESEPMVSRTVNALAPGVLAEECARLGAPLIHYSTDYVFDGRTDRPYTEAEVPNPINTYGSTKLKGEQAIRKVGGIHLILRTSWVYGLRRQSFVTQVLAWARSQAKLRVVEDQIGSPTWCRSLAHLTVSILRTAKEDPQHLAAVSGTYHLACGGAVTRLDWAREILRLDPLRAEQLVSADAIEPARTWEFPSAAARPAYSALDSSLFERQFGVRPPSWSQALSQAMAAG